MCLALFLATTKPVAPVPLNDANPQFNIQPITDRERPVLAQFSKPSVVYLGSHTGCSCGFGYCMHGDPPPEPPEVDTPEDVAELERVRASVSALRACLAECLSREEAVELFACWEGDEESQPEERADVTPEHFGGDSFRLIQKGFYVVRRAG